MYSRDVVAEELGEIVMEVLKFVGFNEASSKGSDRFI